MVALTEAAVKRRGLTVISSQGLSFNDTVEIGTNKRTGEIRTAGVTGLRLTDRVGKPITFRTDPGFNHAPGTGLADALQRKQAAAGLDEV